MSRILITFGILCVCAVLPGGVSARQPTPVSGLTVIVDDKGAVSLEVKVVPPPATPPPDGRAAGRAYGFFLVALPLALNLDEKNLNFANMRLSPVHVGKGYTLLSLIMPVNSGEVRFRLNDVAVVKETREGRGLLELDYSYQDMSPDERDLLGLPTAISEFDLQVFLPDDYDVRDVAASPAAVSNVRANLYALDYAKLRQEPAKKVSISFPNPIKGVSENVKLVLTLLGSILLVWGELKLFKEKDVKWPLGVFALSAAMLVIVFYYAYALRSVAEFRTFAAAFVPQVFYGLVSSVYQMLASSFQAKISGYISLDGQPGDLVEVHLRWIAEETVSLKRTVAKDGKYEFHLWVWREVPRKYQVYVPESLLRGSGSSDFFDVRERKPYPLNPIQLRSRDIPAESRAEAETRTTTGPSPAGVPPTPAHG